MNVPIAFKRRLLCLIAVTFGSTAVLSAPASTTLVQQINTQGAVLLMRHSTTVPGTGDPPGFKLDQCSTQRNLSEQGKEQARALGRWLKAQGIRIDEVRTS